MIRKFIPRLCALSACAGILLAQAPPAAKKAATPPAGAAKKGPATPAARPNLLKPATLNAKAPETFKVKFATTAGDFTVSVTRSWSPLGADRFYNLVKNGFYNDAGLFRVVPGFVVQFGIGARPDVNAAWEKATIKDEPVTQTNKRGTLCYAKPSFPDSRTTQVFINLGNNARLDQMGFSPFAEVTEGMDVVDKINSAYGEQPDQGRITMEGSKYLHASFPKLDFIKTTLIEGLPVPAAKPAPAKPAAPKATPKAAPSTAVKK